MPPGERPNLLLVCVDQWRGDCFSGAGHPVVLTPYLDAWMATGTRFARAYSATPTCVPARAALFTGMDQRHHGRVGYRDGVPWDYPVTLAGELTAAGYQTQAVGKMHVYPERNPMGFDEVALHDGYLGFSRAAHPDLSEVDDYLPWLQAQVGYPADYVDHGLNCNSIVARPWDKPEWVHPTTWTVTRSIEFLRERDRERPFFLYTSFHRPHPPLDPPGWAFDMYLDQEMPPVPIGDWEGMWADQPADRVGRTYQRLDPRLLHRARAGYYGHMSHIDQQVQRLLDELFAQELLADTVICFVSDHGEMMGDHNLYRKALPYEGSARIAFAIGGPGVPAGRVDDAVVELRDVMPTLLDCAGVPVPSTVDGVSVLSGQRRDYLHGEHVYFGQSIQWLTDGHEKYVWCSGSRVEQLFDLKTDPHELHDLAGDDPRTAVWRDRLVGALTDRPEGFVSEGRLVTGRPVDAVLPFLTDRSGRR